MVDVADLLAEEELGLRALVLPRPDAAIRWVATSELEDPTPFLEGGELLLTTGLSTRGWRREWDEYVERLARAGITGVGLGIGLTHRAVPAALVRACERAGLNLVEVPRVTAFVTVSRTAARLIEERDVAEARLALATQRGLTAAAVRPEAQDAVVARLAGLLEGAAVLVSRGGRVLLGPHGPRKQLLDVAAVDAELPRLRTGGLRAAATFGDTERTTLVVPVGLKGRPSAYLALAVAGRMTDTRRNAVTTAVALLGLIAEQDRQRLETRRTLWRKVHELLAHGDVEAARLVGEAADAPPLPGRLRVLRAAGSEDALEDARALLERDGLLVARAGDQVWVVTTPAQATRRADALADLGCHVGLGEVVILADVATGHATAAQALERSTANRPVVHWDRLVREGTVGLLAPDVAASFAQTFLGSLDGSQRETLAAFLRHHGSRLKVAEELGLHRNTVRHRLGAIEALLGRSLDDPDTRAAAWLALQASQADAMEGVSRARAPGARQPS